MKWSLFFDRRTKAEKPAVSPDPLREVRLGVEAQMLRDSPAYQRAVELMRVKLHEQWAASPLTDLEGQHKLRLMLNTLDALEDHIRTEADTGKLAKRQIDEQAKRTKKAA